MMKTHVTYFSDAFNLTEQKANFINPDCFGEDLAAWMISALQLKSGFEVDPNPCAEDWGWAVLLSRRGRKFQICIGRYQMGRKNGWLNFVQSNLPFYKKWLGVRDGEELAEVCTALDEILKLNPEICDVRWHAEAAFTKGNEDDWSSSPMRSSQS